MGPKVKFSKEQIVNAAFEVAKTEGIERITMRKVADKLGSSVAPIYVNFKDANELTKAVIEKIMEISQQFLLKESTGRPFHDMGMASIKFAEEYSVLFRDLIMKNNPYMQDYDNGMLPILIQEMKRDPDLEGFTDDELNSILLKMKVFQMGLSVMVANGLLPGYLKRHDMEALLSSTCRDIIFSTRAVKNNNQKFTEM